MNQQTEIRPFPKKSFWTLAVVTVVIGATLLILKVFADNLNEQVNLNPGIPNVTLAFALLLGIIIWPLWLMFFAKKWLIGFLAFVLPAAWVVLYHPTFGGDAEIVGWEPRFWRGEFQQPAEISDSDPERQKADLKTRTEYDFPQFLGLERNGSVPGIELAQDWNERPPKQLWKQPIGEGWSGFVAVNGFAITQEQREDDECVSCYNIETGELIWLRSVKRRHEDIIGLGKAGPRATPTIDDGLIYVMGGTGVLDCLEGSNGSLVWSADIPELVGITLIERTNSRGLAYTTEDSTLDWGRSGSPVIFENMVIVSAGGPKKDPDGKTVTLIAFDKKTGEEIWRGGNLPIAYGSPTIAMIDGQPQVVLVAESFAVGHDALTGVELWRHQRSGSSNADANCSQVTLLQGRRFLVSKGYNMGGEIFELQQLSMDTAKPADQDVLAHHRYQTVSLKTDPRVLKTKFTNPVIRDHHAFCLSDGYLECTELLNKSGDKSQLVRKWKQRGRFGNGQLLLVGDMLLVHSENGELMLVAANPAEYQMLGSIKTVSGICWNTIGVYKNRILVRSQKEAACFELPLR
jgi:outer membrane protein assembly factor BamB